LKTDCEIVLEDGSITRSNITLAAKVSGIEAGKFEELVKDAEANCPVSKLLNAKITVNFVKLKV
jgi:osmotically inducible protein OsmC